MGDTQPMEVIAWVSVNSRNINPRLDRNRLHSCRALFSIFARTPARAACSLGSALNSPAGGSVTPSCKGGFIRVFPGGRGKPRRPVEEPRPYAQARTWSKAYRAIAQLYSATAADRKKLNQYPVHVDRRQIHGEPH